MLKRTICLQLLLLIVCFPVTVLAMEEVKVGAAAAILIDQESRRVLFQKNPHLVRPMASVTKIMTAILALEYGNLDDEVLVSEKAAGIGGSSIWLEEGEPKTLEELLYGLILYSGNDAALAIAEHIAGSAEQFNLLMNNKARQIGAFNTSFRNPHGLHEEDHHSTAYDLALISAYAMDNTRFRELSATKQRTISWPGQPWDRSLENQNRLLSIYPGGDGIKTGWTDQAGRCFAGSATRDGLQLITVVLNAPQMWEDAILLLDYGFSQFQRKKLLSKGQLIASVPVGKGKPAEVAAVAAADLHYPLLPGESRFFNYVINLGNYKEAPIKEGSLLGHLDAYLGGQVIGRVELLAGHSVSRLTLWQQFKAIWRTFLKG